MRFAPHNLFATVTGPRRGRRSRRQWPPPRRVADVCRRSIRLRLLLILRACNETLPLPLLSKRYCALAPSLRHATGAQSSIFCFEKSTEHHATWHASVERLALRSRSKTRSIAPAYVPVRPSKRLMGSPAAASARHDAGRPSGIHTDPIGATGSRCALAGGVGLRTSPICG